MKIAELNDTLRVRYGYAVVGTMGLGFALVASDIHFVQAADHRGPSFVQYETSHGSHTHESSSYSAILRTVLT